MRRVPLPRCKKSFNFDMQWDGSIVLHDTTALRGKSVSITQRRQLTSAGISVSSPNQQPSIRLPDGASLRFLSIVETSRIPLYLVLSSPCSVSTSDAATECCFRDVLLSSRTADDAEDGSSWWTAARPDSPLGILVAVESSIEPSCLPGPRVTEILFYASRSSKSNSSSLTPPPSSPRHDEPTTDTNEGLGLSVNAVALSSDLLYHAQHAELTPPASPRPEDQRLEAVFLPPPFSAETEVINEPPVRKRKSAADAFDEANERRKKARRKGGEGVAAVAASKSESQVLSLQHRRSTSTSHAVPLQSRPLSRSPSVSSSRPPTAVAASRRSTLSRVQSVAITLEESTIESRNKELISRITMAGMRLYGLVQSKRRKIRASSTAPSPAVNVGFEELEAERKNDETYKLVYHQTFKGTCFAFRATVERESLHFYSEPVRDVVDILLAIFCGDPLAAGLGSSVDKLTPGGRQAFGSRTADVETNQFSIFEQGQSNASAPNSCKWSNDG